MGGIETAAASAAGLSAAKTYNDLSYSKKKASRDIKNQQYNQLNNMKNKQNILEKQLAQRRARLGSMGINSSGSENALQQNMIKEAYDDIQSDNVGYSNQYSNIKNNYQYRLRKNLLDFGQSGLNGFSSKVEDDEDERILK